MRADIKQSLVKWVLIGVLAFFMAFTPALAQSTDGLEGPDFTVGELQRRIANLKPDDNLSEQDVNLLKAQYESAITTMASANAQREIVQRLIREQETASATIDEIKNQIKIADNAPLLSMSKDSMTDEDLFLLEGELRKKQSEVSSLRAEIEGYEQTLNNQNDEEFREKLSTHRQVLSNISAQLAELGEGELGPLERASKTLLEARQYNQQASIAAIEQELAAIPTKLEIISLREELAKSNLQRAEKDVQTLQSQTGKRRVNEAQKIFEDAELGISLLENAHPLILDYAAENLSIARQNLDITQNTSAYPRRKAQTRSQASEIASDAQIAEDLTSVGQINRESGAILRRLKDQRPSINQVKSDIKSNRKRQILATQNELRAEQRRRNMPIGQFDEKPIFNEWKADNPDALELTDSDLEILNALYIERRELLRTMANSAREELAEIKDLETEQQKLLEQTTRLASILNKNILWLPSVQAINLDWPAKVTRGVLDVMSLSNASKITQTFGRQIKAYWLPMIFAMGFAGFFWFSRRRLREEVSEISRRVGRVKKDNFWLTPQTLLATILIAAPLPLILLMLGIVFKYSGSPDSFILSFGQSGIELAGFIWFFLIWREWNREKSLYAAHYNVPLLMRDNSLKQFNWFIPLAGLSTALVTLTQNSRNPDVYEGFSLLAFIITALLLAWLGLRLLVLRKTSLVSVFSKNSLFRKYHKIFVVLAVGLPLLSALLAAIGYYDTARVLLSRLFFSGGVIVITHTLYGLFRRTLIVAQRRLSLRQAIEKQEKEILARAQEEAAEERGEIPPPTVNYDEIDVESLSRQSVQLINTFVAVGFAIIMWMLWRDLFPALAIFDSVNLWPTEFNVDGAATSHVSLWKLIQSLAIVVLTVISAKNLPALLEVFVLNRSQMDRGTRYAVVSVLGYIIIALGLVWAFSRLGVDWSKLQWIVAALSVGIGFGLQEIIANFISGLIILFERPIRVGDYITIGEQSGTVHRIKIRATTLSDLDNREIFIPNKELITQKVMNWTLTDSITRLIIPVGIAYGSDTDKAREIMQNVIYANSRVLDRPKSNVFFLGFGDSSLDFELRIFVRSVDDRFSVSHEIHTAINKALAKADIEIPFPQRDLHFRSGSPS
ncbi:MAG: mechanosensitive ion channel [Hellea sp.]|nr:mechanosensitive ion channel [Hellea sp.]